MKILEIIYCLNQGGAERFVVDLSNELVQLGNDVTLCVFRDDTHKPEMSFNKQFLSDEVKYVNLRIPEGITLSALIKVHKFVENENPDIIHCHLNVVPYIYLYALLNKHVKIFHTLHNLADKTLFHKSQYYLNKFFYSMYKIYPITISDKCDKSYRKFYSLDNSFCIINGRSKVFPTENNSLVIDEVNSYKINVYDKVFIHVARYNKQKNQHLLVDVFNKLNEENIPYILLVIGEDFNTKEGLELQKIACSRIKFLGVKYNVGDYLLCSDAFCLTSIYEGLPISLLEALSCGCVPICTSVGGISDIIIDGKIGYLSEDLTIDSYLDAVRRYLSNPYFISKPSLQYYYINNFSMKKCADAYLKQFKI